MPGCAPAARLRRHRRRRQRCARGVAPRRLARRRRCIRRQARERRRRRLGSSRRCGRTGRGGRRSILLISRRGHVAGRPRRRPENRAELRQCGRRQRTLPARRHTPALYRAIIRPLGGRLPAKARPGIEPPVNTRITAPEGRDAAFSTPAGRPGTIVAGRPRARDSAPASSRAGAKPPAFRSYSGDAASARDAACTLPRSAPHRPCGAASHAMTAVPSRPPHSRYRSPSAARRAASDRFCRPWCGNSGCRTRPRRRARHRRQVQNCVPNVWPFHQVKSLSRNCFMDCAPKMMRLTCQLRPDVSRVALGMRAPRRCAVPAMAAGR